jgi:NAD-dependent dihydropyrimidine dehydrogenase PreA subunit
LRASPGVERPPSQESYIDGGLWSTYIDIKRLAWKRRSPAIEWGATIDAAACTGCGTFIDFCHNDVYRWSDDESTVVVAHKTHCVTGCSHCGTLCETQAISFPTLEDIKHARRGE